MKQDKEAKGFTLFEVLLVIAVIAILAGISILALNSGGTAKPVETKALEVNAE